MIKKLSSHPISVLYLLCSLGTLLKLSGSHLFNGLLSGVLVHVLQWLSRKKNSMSPYLLLTLSFEDDSFGV